MNHHRTIIPSVLSDFSGTSDRKQLEGLKLTSSPTTTTTTTVAEAQGLLLNHLMAILISLPTTLLSLIESYAMSHHYLLLITRHSKQHIAYFLPLLPQSSSSLSSPVATSVQPLPGLFVDISFGDEFTWNHTLFHYDPPNHTLYRYRRRGWAHSQKYHITDTYESSCCDLFSFFAFHIQHQQVLRSSPSLQGDDNDKTTLSIPHHYDRWTKLTDATSSRYNEIHAHHDDGTTSILHGGPSFVMMTTPPSPSSSSSSIKVEVKWTHSILIPSIGRHFLLANVRSDGRGKADEKPIDELIACLYNPLLKQYQVLQQWCIPFIDLSTKSTFAYACDINGEITLIGTELVRPDTDTSSLCDHRAPQAKRDSWSGIDACTVIHCHSLNLASLMTLSSSSPSLSLSISGNDDVGYQLPLTVALDQWRCSHSLSHQLFDESFIISM
jgi:hypothetical protein